MLVDVERRAGDRAVPERRDERRLVDDRASRGVHEHGRRPHPRERRRVDQVPRLRRQRAVQADDVGGLEQRVELVAAAGEDRARAERLGERRRRAPDPSGPDDAERLAAQRLAEHELERERPPRLPAQEPVSLGDAAEQRERERDRQLGDGVGQHVGRVRDEDVARARGFEIDVVDADAVVRDDAELRPGAVEQLAVDRRRQHREDSVDALDAVGERERLRERLVHAGRQLAGDVDGRRHATRSALTWSSCSRGFAVGPGDDEHAHVVLPRPGTSRRRRAARTAACRPVPYECETAAIRPFSASASHCPTRRCGSVPDDRRRDERRALRQVAQQLAPDLVDDRLVVELPRRRSAATPACRRARGTCPCRRTAAPTCRCRTARAAAAAERLRCASTAA